MVNCGAVRYSTRINGAIRGGPTVADPAIFPEQRFLRSVFPEQFSGQVAAALFEPDAENVLHELRQQIDTALSALSYRERGILEMRYGLGDGHAYTLAESGYVFQLTRERIRQLQARALKKLRKRAVDLQDFVSRLNLRRDGVNAFRPARN
jgi:RNA polymerase sigma factor (sigma-70 family)